MSILSKRTLCQVSIWSLVLLLFTAGTGNAEYMLKWAVGVENATAIAGQDGRLLVTDFNGDTYPDIRVTTGSYGFTILSGLDGDSLWSFYDSLWVWVGYGNTDLDSDLEIILARSEYDTLTMKFFSDIRILDASSGVVEDSLSGSFGPPTLVDVDGDDVQEIIVARGADTVACYEFVVSVGLADDRGQTELPTGFTLGQNFPNPFNPSTTISYSVDASGQVHIAVYNVLGRLVRALVDEPQNAGKYEIDWDGTDERGNRVASGVYFYQLRIGSDAATRKMVQLK